VGGAGLDYYHVPLAMLTWGQRWHTAEADPVLTHKLCEHALRAQLACASCDNAIFREDILLM
jgi:hypothetical protein